MRDTLSSTLRWVIGALVLAPGCSAVLGLDDFADDPGAGATSSATASGGSSSGGSSSASASGGGGSGASGGAGGDGGEAPMICLPGERKDCYSGPAGTDGVGLCTHGTQTCNAAGSEYGPCNGEVLPALETCANAGDEDCDGMTNEEGADCDCAPGSMQACYSADPATKDVGPCKGGDQTCNPDGMGFGACIGEVTPQNETCNTPIDDDCDGMFNEEGVGCICPPNGTVACYAGPPDTENVGNCKAGASLCNDQGTVLGPCMGEVLPGPSEVCLTAGDENCDGIKCGDPLWAKQFGGQGFDEIVDMAVDSQGNLIIVGSFESTLDFGGGVLTSAGDNDVFVAKLDQGGNHIWSKRFGDAPGEQRAFSVAIDANDNIVVGGLFTSTVDFGGGALVSVGGADVFVVKLGPTGLHTWSKRYGDASYQGATRVDTTAAGEVLVAGDFQGVINFGGGNLTSAGSNDIFLAKLTAAGNYAAQKRYGDSADQQLRAMTADSVGSMWIHVMLKGTVDFGGGAITGAFLGSPVMAKYDVNLNHVASAKKGDCSASFDLVTDASDNVIAGGGLGTNNCNFGGGALGVGPFIAKMNPSGGHIWSTSYGGFASGQTVAVDSSGNIILGGAFSQVYTIGGTTLTPTGGSNAFLAKLPSGGGNAIWARGYGAGPAQSFTALAIGPQSSIFLGGYNKGTVDFGFGPLVSAGSDEDFFVGRMAP